MKRTLPTADGLMVKRTRNGRGIIATRVFSQRDIVFEVLGKRVTLEEDWLTQKDRDNTYRYSSHYYISPKGKIGDFLNHSCKPNSFVKKTGTRLLADELPFMQKLIQTLSSMK